MIGCLCVIYDLELLRSGFCLLFYFRFYHGCFTFSAPPPPCNYCGMLRECLDCDRYKFHKEISKMSYSEAISKVIRHVCVRHFGGKSHTTVCSSKSSFALLLDLHFNVLKCLWRAVKITHTKKSQC